MDSYCKAKDAFAALIWTQGFFLFPMSTFTEIYAEHSLPESPEGHYLRPMEPAARSSPGIDRNTGLYQGTHSCVPQRLLIQCAFRRCKFEV